MRQHLCQIIGGSQGRGRPCNNFPHIYFDHCAKFSCCVSDRVGLYRRFQKFERVEITSSKPRVKSVLYVFFVLVFVCCCHHMTYLKTTTARCGQFCAESAAKHQPTNQTPVSASLAQLRRRRAVSEITDEHGSVVTRCDPTHLISPVEYWNSIETEIILKLAEIS